MMNHDNDNLFDNPEDAIDLDDTPSGRRETTPEDRAAARARSEARREAEAVRMAGVRARIRARQKIGEGWDGAANDNEDMPLLRTLRKADDQGRIALVHKYRGIVALCAAEPLRGQDYAPTEAVRKEHRTSKMRGKEEIEQAEAEGWPDDTVPGGEIEYKEQRKARGGRHAGTATRKRAARGDISADREPLEHRFKPDTLLAQIDAKPFLAELRDAMGPLVDPFEDAALCGATLAEIGRDRAGAKVKPEIAGRALVFTALDALSDAWSRIARRERARAAECEEKVAARRIELAAA